MTCLLQHQGLGFVAAMLLTEVAAVSHQWNLTASDLSAGLRNALCAGAGANAEVRGASEALPLRRASHAMGGRRLNFLPLRASLFFIL